MSLLLALIGGGAGQPSGSGSIKAGQSGLSTGKKAIALAVAGAFGSSAFSTGKRGASLSITGKQGATATSAFKRGASLAIAGAFGQTMSSTGTASVVVAKSGSGVSALGLSLLSTFKRSTSAAGSSSSGSRMSASGSSATTQNGTGSGSMASGSALSSSGKRAASLSAVSGSGSKSSVSGSKAASLSISSRQAQAAIATGKKSASSSPATILGITMAASGTSGTTQSGSGSAAFSIGAFMAATGSAGAPAAPFLPSGYGYYIPVEKKQRKPIPLTVEAIFGKDESKATQTQRKIDRPSEDVSAHPVTGDAKSLADDVISMAMDAAKKLARTLPKEQSVRPTIPVRAMPSAEEVARQVASARMAAEDEDAALAFMGMLEMMD